MRDRLLGNEPADYDVATDAVPEQICGLFDKRVEVGSKFGVILVRDGGAPVEVATFRTDGQYLDGRHPENVTYGNEQDDARRRDFTINGMFLDPQTDTVIDYVDGQKDLVAGVVRAIGDPAERFAEDRLRMMRAARFAARLDFVLDPPTAAAIQMHAPSIHDVSPERIREELVKMITGPRPHVALDLLDRYGLLEQILPEITAMKGVEQPANFHPEGDVFVHTLLCMSKLESPSVEAAMGTLLHDVAKPPTYTVTDRIRYPKHEAIGAEMTEVICKRLRFSNKQTERIVWLVKRHLVFKDTKKMRASRLKRLLADEGFLDLAVVCRADALGSNGDLSYHDYCMEMHQKLGTEQIKPKPWVNGDDLIAMGLRPGPLFAGLLEEAYTAQLEGEIADRQGALERLERVLSLRGLLKPR